MNISKRSWHYWLYNQFTDVDPYYGTNLCQYVQTILLGIAKFLFTCLAICLVALGVGFVICVVCTVSIRFLHFLHWYSLLIPIVIAVVWWLIHRYRSFQYSSTHDLVSEYIQAKKDRYCPTVKFTE